MAQTQMIHPSNLSVPEQRISLTLPSTHVKMLLVQPFIEFSRPLQEPFTLTPQVTTHIRSGIDNVFAVAEEFHPHFILFPEFSLPGVSAVEAVRDYLLAPACRHPVILIGGVHGLSRDEYTKLCALSGPQVVVDPSNSPDVVRATEWVNTSVTFVKDDNGTLALWIQPKISPSWPEASTPHQSMFQGSVVRVFRAAFDNGYPCQFLSLLCFDWIGTERGTPLIDEITQHFDTACRQGGSPQGLQWVFVLQHNRMPNDRTFLAAANRFLTQSAFCPFVQRRDSAVVMACTAASRAPARASNYGFSSLIFGPLSPFDSKVCCPTFATQSRRLRATDALGTCKDVVFREMGECIHRVEVRVPNFVVPDSTDRTPALERAEVFPFQPPVDDPRIPSASVPAVVKWTNDELDSTPDLCGTYFSRTPLEEPVRGAQDTTVKAYRYLQSQNLAIRIHGATASRLDNAQPLVDPATDADTWDIQERQGLQHIIQTLTLIGCVSDIDAVGSELHARHPETGVEIAAICGPTHDACKRAFKPLAERTYSPIILVSRDDNNVALLPRELEAFADPREGAGVKLTDSQQLLSTARTSSEEEYTNFIVELLNVTERRII
jgi:hypothetical protein